MNQTLQANLSMPMTVTSRAQHTFGADLKNKSFLNEQFPVAVSLTLTFLYGLSTVNKCFRSQDSNWGLQCPILATTL